MQNLLEIVFNLGMLSAISILAGIIDFSAKIEKGKVIILGLLFGVASIIGMLHPLVLMPGLIFDGRSVMLSICGLFFGPIAAAISATMALALRIYQGGAGAIMGVSVITTSALIGVVFHYIYKRKAQKITIKLLLLMGFIVHTLMVILMLTLPKNIRIDTIKQLAFPVLAAYPLTTIFIGKILSEFIHFSQLKVRQSNILEGTNAGTWEWDVKNQRTIFNEQWAALFGYTLEELGSPSFDTWKKHTHPDDFVRAMTHLNDHFSKKTDYYECEFRMKHKEGHWVWILARGKVISWTPAGKPLWMFGTHRDITAQKNTEEALKKEEEHLRITLDSIGDAVLTTDIHGKITRMNPMAEKLTGWNIKEALGHHSEEVFRIVNNQSGEKVSSPIHNALQTGNIVDLSNHTKLISKDGTEYQISDSGAPIKDEKGNVIGAVLVFRDISLEYSMKENLKESEEKYRTLVNNLPIGIFRSTIEGKILSCNPAMVKIYGYNDDKELLETAAQNFYDSSQDREIIISRLKKETCLQAYETIERQKDGTKIWVSTNYTAVKDKNGNIISIDGSVQDVTSRKESVEILKDSELKYRKLFENAREGIFQTSIEGKYLKVNPALASIYGYNSPEELISSRNDIALDSYFSPEERNWFVQKMLEDGFVSGFEYRVKKKDGTIIWLYEDAQLIKDETGEPLYFEGFVVDVTERKNSEEKIKKLSRAVDQNPASIVITDLHGKIEYTNPQFTKITGYKSEEALGKNPRLLKSGNTPPEVYKDLWNTILNSENWKGELQNRKKNGEYYWEMVTISPLRNDNGEITHFIGVKEDITTKKRSELLHRIQYNIANAMVVSKSSKELFEVVCKELSYVVDTRNFTVAFLNKEHNTLYSVYWTDEKDYIIEWPADKTLSGMVVKEGNPLYLNKKQIEQLLDDKGWSAVGTMAEFWMGVPLTIHGENAGVIITQSYEQANAVSKYGQEVFTIVANQVSLYLEKKQYEEQLIAAKEKAEESDRLKSAFLSNMSHEIRTPVNGMIGLLKIIQRKKLTETKRNRYISLVNKSGNRLVETINDIIEMSKIESGQYSINKEEIPLDEMLQFFYDFFKPQSVEKGLQFILSKSHEQITILGDRQKIEGILTNLIKNAIKFTDTGHIEFGFQMKDQNVTFFVKDTGIGIPEDRLDAIFDRFIQADLSDTRGHEGSGLGLSISKAYAELLDGNISVESKLGAGSSFYLSIPRN